MADLVKWGGGGIEAERGKGKRKVSQFKTRILTKRTPPSQNQYQLFQQTTYL
jgi:hypothetical protein